MVYQWEPDTQYNYGDLVVYEGHQYKISDWAPPLTPALWERVHEEYHGGDQQSYQAPQQQQQQPNPGYSYGAPPGQGGGYQYDNHAGSEKHPEQTVDIDHDERKKNWFDLSDERKKQLEIGGGLLAGAAVLGAGYFAWHEHEKNEDKKKAYTWGLQNWLKEAKDRTDAFYQHGPRSPTTWILAQGRNIPQGAIPGGEENGQPIYICRAFHEGSLQVGKASSNLKEGAAIGYGHKEINLPTYEILLGDPRAVRWVNFRGRLDLQELAARPVEAGRESNGTPLYVAQCHHNNGVHPGKISEKLNSAFIPYGGTEKEVKEYRVLCYN